jgi:Flp pilus assembly protein TadG
MQEFSATKPLAARLDSNGAEMLTRLARLTGNRSGNVAMMFALAIIPFVVIAGLAVDFGRALHVRARLEHALDAAGLAVGAAQGLTQDEAQALGEDFFAANYPESALGAPYELTVTQGEESVVVSARAKVETTLLAIIGKDEIDVGREVEIERDGQDLELVMVLDNTGSMSGSKIDSLRDAADSAAEILFDNAAGREDGLKIGLVPFSSTVNVGTSHERAWWMDADGESPLHSYPLYFNKKVNRWDLFDALREPWAGCVEARPEPYDLDDTAPDPANPETLFVPYFAPDEPGGRGDDDSGYSNSYISDGDWSDYRDYYSYDVGSNYEFTMNEAEAMIDGLEEGEGLVYRDREGAKQANADKYFQGETPRYGGPNDGCSARPITPMTDNESGIRDEIGNMIASGNTNIHNAIAWGVRVLSPGEPFTEGRPWGDDKLVKALIILTDGDNVVRTRSNHNKSDYNAYGYIEEGRFGVVSTSSSTMEDRMDDKTAEVCEIAKDLGTRVYTITFQVSSSSTRSLMENCASKDDDGKALYWNSPSSADLESAFREIAKDLTQLRLKR